MDLFVSATSHVSNANQWFEFLGAAFAAASELLSRWRCRRERRQDEAPAERGQLKWKREDAKMKQLHYCMLQLPDLISHAEWFSFVKGDKEVARLLPELKVLVYDAYDLLDEFNRHHRQLQPAPDAGVELEQPPWEEDGFLQGIAGGNMVSEILDDLNCLRNTLGAVLNRRVRSEPPHQIGKLLRPAMSCFYDKSKVRSLESEVSEVLELLEVKMCSGREHKRRIEGEAASARKRTRMNSGVPSASTRSSCSNQEYECASENVNVLAISGIGGVGKTTLARQVYNDERAEEYFDLRIWISVSDDFNVKRLTKEFIEFALADLMQSDNLCNLQQRLTGSVVRFRFLLVLDDVWDDVYANQDNRWQEFLEPLKSAQQGSAILLTTRSERVADLVNKNKHFRLEGLPPTIFDEFFQACAFGPDCCRVNPELNLIGKSIIPQLKRCPLAAETIGRLLKPMLDREHWNSIAESELWELKQEQYDILPVLRLSYLYLPSHLRNCFLFCSMYPKKHQFDKDTLVNCWIAAGLVESCKGGKLESHGCQYFEELLHRSLLHKDASGPADSRYVMHELIYDMAQLVSEEECFIVKGETDLKKIPQSVRHLSIIGSSSLNEANLRMVCKFKRLRSIVCHGVEACTLTAAAKYWFEELTKIRMLGFLSCKLNFLPETIEKLKLLRYLNISECTFEELPPSFWQLQSLKIVDAEKCRVKQIPDDFNRLGNLQRFKLRGRIIKEPGTYAI
ncbi:putative disease resistance RPP13-like protein 1 [Oryza brachyantha]|nr:putative disease resistance RPP13-like protein 1 [Oryza brachyantha]XP_040383835.1 putative disease resistance RPP13-like protein 1 [Oryza brachyantha]